MGFSERRPDCHPPPFMGHPQRGNTGDLTDMPFTGRSFRTVVAAAVALSAGAASPPATTPPAERGEALATRLGCRSCHEPDLTGKPILDDPTIAFLYSANLSIVARRYSDQELERTIRTGVRPDGSHLWMMAAAPYALLTPRDMADLIAYLRSVPATGEDHGRIRMGPRFLKAVKAQRLQPEAIEQARDKGVPPDFGPALARGRYLTRTICAGCHYPSLGGLPDPQDGDPPDLTVAAGYDRTAFHLLLRTGKAPGDRSVGVMSEEAPKRFAGLADAEIDAILVYLRRRAASLPVHPDAPRTR
jgi:mono/diheme cytochrome c family protein/cytochrome c553